MLRKFEIKDLVCEAHTVKTTNNQIWVNIGNGKFILRQSIFNNHTRLCNVFSIYNQIKCVMSRGEVIAKKNNKTGELIRVNEPQKINEPL